MVLYEKLSNRFEAKVSDQNCSVVFFVNRTHDAASDPSHNTYQYIP